MKRAIIILIAALFLMLLNATLVFAAEKIFYYHTDQAGTPLAMTDESGTVVWKADYRPFGEEQSINPAAVENNEKFVGKEKDKETGLYYFGARYMQDKIGRFISPDPVGPIDPMTGQINQKVLMNPQMLNPYAYALNNPYRYVDPDGQWPEQVHNLIIQNAFSSGGYNLSPTAIAGLMKGSRTADSQQYQDLAHSYMHAMRAPGQSADEAAGLTVTFINQQVAEYKRLMAAGLEGKAYEALGMAMHPLMDATSPSHEGYQEWGGLFPVIDGTTKRAYIHNRSETADVFNSNPNYSSRAIEAVRKVYNGANQ